MKRLLLVLLLSTLPIAVAAQNAPTSASRTALTIVSLSLEGWQDTHPGSYELWIFSDQDWVDTNNTPHGTGNPQSKIWTYRITGLSLDNNAHTLTVPSFPLQPTRSAIRGNSVRLTFYIAAVRGSSITFITQIPSTTNGLHIPATLTSSSICS